jgi:hypothetical protein
LLPNRCRWRDDVTLPSSIKDLSADLRLIVLVV